MKGKRQRARHNRLAQAAAAELERLRTEIAAELARGEAARSGAEQTRVARQRLPGNRLLPTAGCNRSRAPQPGW